VTGCGPAVDIADLLAAILAKQPVKAIPTTSIVIPRGFLLCLLER